MDDLKNCIENTTSVLKEMDPTGELSGTGLIVIMENQIAIMKALCGDCGKKADMRILEMIQDRAAKGNKIHIYGLIGLTDYLRSLFPEYYKLL